MENEIEAAPPVRLTRRAVMTGLAILPVAVAGSAGIEILPDVFDPKAFIADIRAIGLELRAIPTHRTYAIMRGDGEFGMDWYNVSLKWGKARDADPYDAIRVCDALMEEQDASNN